MGARKFNIGGHCLRHLAAIASTPLQSRWPAEPGRLQNYAAHVQAPLHAPSAEEAHVQRQALPKKSANFQAIHYDTGLCISGTSALVPGTSGMKLQVSVWKLRHGAEGLPGSAPDPQPYASLSARKLQRPAFLFVLPHAIPALPLKFCPLGCLPLLSTLPICSSVHLTQRGSIHKDGSSAEFESRFTILLCNRSALSFLRVCVLPCYYQEASQELGKRWASDLEALQKSYSRRLGMYPKLCGTCLEYESRKGAMRKSASNT